MPRKIVELDVDEISSVDRPANKRRFLMIKRDDDLDKLDNSKLMDLRTFIEENEVAKEEAESVISAFYQSVNKIISDADAEARDKLQMIQRSAGQLVNFLREATTSFKNSDTNNGGDSMEDLLKSIEDEELREQLESKFENLQSQVDELKNSEPEGDEGDEGDDTEVNKAELPEEVRIQMEKMQEELTDAKKMAKEERQARRKAELTKRAESLKSVGEVDDIVEVLLALDESDSEVFEKVETLLESAAGRLEEADLFKEKGDSGSDITSAGDELNKKAEKLMEGDADMTFEKAFAKAAKRNPALYRDYKEAR